MDTASIPERSIGSALSQPERAQSGRAFDRVRAAELHASAHVLAVLLILAASVLLRDSIADASRGMPGLVCLVVAVLVLVGARRIHRAALIADARRRGLHGMAAKADARRRMEGLTRPHRPGQSGQSR